MSHLWIVQWIYVLHPLHSSCIPLSIKQTIILTPKNYINNFYMGNSPANINSKMKQGRAYRATKQDFEISQSHKLLFLRLRYSKYVVSSCHQLFTSKKCCKFDNYYLQGQEGSLNFLVCKSVGLAVSICIRTLRRPNNWV